LAEVRFYALERRRRDEALSELIAEGLAAGRRVAVQAGDRELAASLDERLWTLGDESFLPHGLASAADASLQPVTLGDDGENPNGAAWRVFVGDADAIPFLAPGAEVYERLIVLFDETSDDAKAAARRAWTAAKAGGGEVSFWREAEDGAWTRSR